MQHAPLGACRLDPGERPARDRAVGDCQSFDRRGDPHAARRADDSFQVKTVEVDGDVVGIDLDAVLSQNPDDVAREVV